MDDLNKIDQQLNDLAVFESGKGYLHFLNHVIGLT